MAGGSGGEGAGGGGGGAPPPPPPPPTHTHTWCRSGHRGPWLVWAAGAAECNSCLVPRLVAGSSCFSSGCWLSRKGSISLFPSVTGMGLLWADRTASGTSSLVPVLAELG